MQVAPGLVIRVLVAQRAVGSAHFDRRVSSLSYLQRLPADSIKIDQSFVTRMLEDDGSNTIVRSTIDLGHNLGLRVVAEGVENRAMWEHLASLGCDAAQGYL